MSNTVARRPIRVRLYVTGVSPRVLAAYRGLRQCGFARQDANLIVVGIVLASGQGVVDVRKPPVAGGV